MKARYHLRSRDMRPGLWARLAASIMLALVACATAWGQGRPIIVSVTALPPYCPDLSIWEGNPNRVLIQLQNVGTRSVDVRLAGFAENLDGSVRVTTKIEYPTPCFTVGVGGTRALNLNDIKLFHPDAVRITGAEKEKVARTRMLPEGSYRICIVAIDCATRDTLSSTEPAGCTQFLIRHVEAPRPITPACGGLITRQTPQILQFQWTMPAGAPAGTQYEFTLVEQPEGRDAEYAVRSAPTPPFFTRTVITPYLLYGPAEPPLQPGRLYAWRVRAIDRSNGVVFRENGYSAACSFRWGDVATSPPGFGGTDTVPRSLPLDSNLFGYTNGEGTGLIPPEKFIPAVLKLPALSECVTIAPYSGTPTDYPEVVRGRGTMSFQVSVEPAIDPDAVTGGMLEVWQADGRGGDPYQVMLDARKVVLSDRFTGGGKGKLRIVRETGAGLILDVSPTGNKFVPKEGTDYIWRFTLEFNGKQIRRDGKICTSDRVASGLARFPDLIIKKKLPDTLLAGGFTIVVEDWDNISRSNDPTRPSGIGRIKFDCTKKVTPGWWQNIGTRVKDFGVVPSISDSLSEVHLLEARYIDPGVSIGDKIALELPAGSIGPVQDMINRNTVIDIYRKLSPDGIRVAFRDVRWTPPTQSKVTLIDGIATYPTVPAIPKPPAHIQLDSGFTLAIDTMWLTPTEAQVQGCILLPTSIITTDTCTRARLCLPWTRITPNCELYRDVPEGEYGPWFVGETGVIIKGRGWVADFSSSQSPAGVLPPLAASWKGIVLREGETPAPPVDSVISNRGYVKAAYTFTNGLITSPGFTGRLGLTAQFTYHALDPFGYETRLTAGYLELKESGLRGGEFQNGLIRLPAAAINNGTGGRITVDYITMEIQGDGDQYADIRTDRRLAWGEYSKTPGSPKFYQIDCQTNPAAGGYYLAARAMKPYYPLVDTNYATPNLGGVLKDRLEMQRIQGATFPKLEQRDFTIFTKDQPDSTKSLLFRKPLIAAAWMNVIRTGVHSEVVILREKELDTMKLGPVWWTGKYQDNVPFQISFMAAGGGSPKESSQWARMMRIQFVESAMWNSDFRGTVRLGLPVNDTIPFKQLMFTSTAECAGGQLDLSQPATLDYWGLDLVAKDPSKSAGIMCVRLGVIYLTAAGLKEERHFKKPFNLVWGEIKASGNMGRLFFDYNSAGQKFDRFGYAPALVKLSKYVPGGVENLGNGAGLGGGYLHTYGSLSISFFGAKQMSISDYKFMRNADTLPQMAQPYGGRFVRVRNNVHLDAPASDLHWERGWAGDLADFDYNVIYDTSAQDGFFGIGTVGIGPIGDALASTITIRAEGNCFMATHETNVELNLGPVANFSSMNSVWGCGCTKGDELEQIAVGAHLSTGGGVGASLLARGGTLVEMKMSFSPTRTKLVINGDMYVVLASAMNAEVTGYAEFVFDVGKGYTEGYMKGTITLSSFIDGISAEGEVQWHVGLDYQSLQGRIAVGMYGPVSTGIESGVWLGVNTPKNKIWVMDGINSRFGLNKAGLPNNLTGLYAFLAYQQSVNLYIVSGGYQFYAGVGVFAGYGGEVAAGIGVIGNVGVRIWGEILGGLVSASAWGNLQLIIGVPPGFHGAIGLEACVLWIFCGSVSVNCGFNAAEGFYIY